MPGMVHSATSHRQGDFLYVCQRRLIDAGQPPARCLESRELLQLLQPHRRAHIAQQVLVARLHHLGRRGDRTAAVPIPSRGGHAVARQKAQMLCPVRVGKRNHAAFHRRDVLDGVHAEAGVARDTPNRRAVETRAQRVRGIFHNRDSVPIGDCLYGLQVNRVPRQVHRHDRLRPRGNLRLQGSGVHVQRFRIDVGEHRARMHVQNGVARGSPGNRRGYHFVARLHPHVHQTEVQCRRARGNRHGMWGIHLLAKGALKGCNLWARGQPAGSERLDDDALLFLANARARKGYEAGRHRLATLVNRCGHQSLKRLYVREALALGVNRVVAQVARNLLDPFFDRAGSLKLKQLFEASAVDSEGPGVRIGNGNFCFDWVTQFTDHQARELANAYVLAGRAEVKHLATHQTCGRLQEFPVPARRVGHMEERTPLLTTAVHDNAPIPERVRHHQVDGEIETHPWRDAIECGAACDHGLELTAVHRQQGLLSGELALAQRRYRIRRRLFIKQVEQSLPVNGAR